MTAERIPRAERERRLRALLEELREAGTPTWPADFAGRAGISKTYLSSFTIYEEVREYALRTAPDKMRGRPPGAATRRGGARSTVRQLRDRLAVTEEARSAAVDRIGMLERDQENGLLGSRERIRQLERMVEALILRAVEAGVNVRDVEEILLSQTPSEG